MPCSRFASGTRIPVSVMSAFCTERSATHALDLRCLEARGGRLDDEALHLPVSLGAGDVESGCFLGSVSHLVRRLDATSDPALVARREVEGMNAFRSMLYRLAKLLGDVQAVRRGRVGRRIGRRLSGKATGRLLGRIFR